MKLKDVYKINRNAILLHSGVLFDVFNPKKEDIKIEDIAHALSNICRYGGHSPKFYSVAQHSVLCSLKGVTPQEQMECLCHDFSEAYLVDLPSPIKKNMPIYVEIENNLLKLIYERYNLNFPLSDRVHKIDKQILKFEYKRFYDNFVDKKFSFWTPEEAKIKLLARFSKLKDNLKLIS